MTCCYAVQNKVWATDPDGNKWEVYVVLDNDAAQHHSTQSGLLRRQARLLRGQGRLLHRTARFGRGRENQRPVVRLCLLRVTQRRGRPMPSQPSTEAMWSHLSSDLRRFIRRRVPDDHAADDLLQETFVRVHRNIGTLQEADRLAAWVYRIARNVVHDHHRKATNAAVALADADPVDDADDRRARPAAGACDWLDEMIRSLPDGYREAVQLAEIEGLSQQEVADRLGLSLSGAKSRIQRGRAMLKGVLEQCCHFEFDGRGNMMDYDPKPDRKVCRDCGE